MYDTMQPFNTQTIYRIHEKGQNLSKIILESGSPGYYTKKQSMYRTSKLKYIGCQYLHSFYHAPAKKLLKHIDYRVVCLSCIGFWAITLLFMLEFRYCSVQLICRVQNSSRYRQGHCDISGSIH